MQRENGMSLIELLVSMTVMLFLIVAVLGAYSQGTAIKDHVVGSTKIQNNVRVAMDRLERDLRMIGYGVPDGIEIGSTTLWTPVVFYANGTSIGFRAEIDGGRAEIVCTPNSSNSDCPLTKLRLDEIDYYKGLNCDRPDGQSGDLRLLAVVDGKWSKTSCSTSTDSDTSITVAAVANNTFLAGTSAAVTVEQVYYQYSAKSSDPYGSVTRQVRYDYTPSNAFPPTGLASSTVARHLTDFWLEYYDASGSQLTGYPLDATERAAISTIVVFMEGYDRAGPEGRPQLIQMRTEILVRNAG